MVVTIILMLILVTIPSQAFCEGEILEIYCPGCNYRGRFLQGYDKSDRAANVQSIVVVCERDREIRNVKIPLNPKAQIAEPLAAREHGTATSQLLGLKLPKFMVPGNTCPLFPVSAYVDQNICPIDGGSGIEVTIVGQF